jgi:eukaryotic-like serine/threonine-protein kinase
VKTKTLRCAATYEPVLRLSESREAVLRIARCRGPLAFEHLVVLKCLSTPADRRDAQPALLEEARIASRIGHPNVIPVTEVVRDNGELALVLPYVESLSLAEILLAARRARRLLPLPVVARIMSDILAGLHATHEARDVDGHPMRIVHGDVSPRNVIVGTDGFSRVVDFGIARVAGREGPHSERLEGTFGYMAPEQLLHKEFDRRADVFAAGALLHEALTGRALFPASDEASVILGVLVGRIDGPSSLVARVPRALDGVTIRALRRRPDRRFTTAELFREALERACRPAPASRVAALVERLGRDTLEARRDRLRRALRRRPH